jgi:nitrate reductase gamma subunit
MSIIPLLLALMGLFLIGGLAASIVEKTGTHGPDMAKTLATVIWVAGIGIVVGILSQVVGEVNTVFRVF